MFIGHDTCTQTLRSIIVVYKIPVKPATFLNHKVTNVKNFYCDVFVMKTNYLHSNAIKT